jgi:hypothetical protein
MSRLTGNDALGLYEAYAAVYSSQELTEEQVWEEVENWVNSLLEEGYDLSEYTWEEMYESYIEEQGNRRGGNRDRGTGIQLSLPGGSAGSGLGRQGAKRAADARASAPRLSNIPPSAGRPQVSNIPPQEGTGRGAPGAGAAPATAPARPAAQAPARPAATAPAARPAATPAATPAAQAPARPAATAPAADAKVSPTATATTPATPARPSLSSQADELRQMRAKSLQRQGKTLDAATVSASTKPAFQASSFDLFDVVIGHLLDEGYADTQEAALVIMANMSEEWRQSIVEQSKFTVTNLDKKLNTPAYRRYKEGNTNYSAGGEGANKLKEA